MNVFYEDADHDEKMEETYEGFDLRSTELEHGHCCIFPFICCF